MRRISTLFGLTSTLAGLALGLGCSSKAGDPAGGSGSGGTAAGAPSGSGGSTAGTSAGGGAAKGGTSGSGGAQGGTTGGGSGSGNGGSTTRGGSGGSSGSAGHAGTTGGGSGGTSSGGTGAGTGGNAGAMGGDAGAGTTGDTGWLYTQGNGIYVSDGTGGGTPWVGRGVNMDDIFLCGYNYTLWMDSPEDTVITIANGLIDTWKPTFIRMSLSMSSFDTKGSWLGDDATYKTPMTKVIQAILAHPGVYVLITLRTDESELSGDEATFLPSDSTNTPDKTRFPRGTDPVFEALVDSFGSSPRVLFGVSNEPGGNQYSDSKIAKAMAHAVATIRAEEDKLGVPHHLVSVQGNGWTSDIGYYADNPLTEDNVVYEVHGYPPPASSYTYDGLPVILGEYGSLDSSSAAAFYADIEQKQIPSLAWDFDPYSNCAPDLVNVDQSATNLTPSAWGKLVKQYLADHAP